MQKNHGSSKIKLAALIIAPVISVSLILFGDLAPENPKITYTLAIAILMAIWWITEAIPLAATALLPVVLFPLFGVVDGKTISAMYFNHLIFLFIGGFLMALASLAGQDGDVFQHVLAAVAEAGGLHSN